VGISEVCHSSWFITLSTGISWVCANDKKSKTSMVHEAYTQETYGHRKNMD
jgi:hypothetical protein